MTTYLVTGGAGFIGSHIAETLLTLPDTEQVRVFDNFSTGHLSNLSTFQPEIALMEADLTDVEQVDQATAGVDIIFHLAAQISVPYSVEAPLFTNQVNTVGTLNLLEAAKRHGVKRIVLSSTCAIYGNEPTLPKHESMPPLPLSPYAVSKLAAEGYCLNYMAHTDLEAVVLRYFNVYGPRQSPASDYAGVISFFADRLQSNQPVTIYGDGEQARDFVFVADVVQANIRAAHTPEAAGHIFNIGTEKPTTINQLYRTLAHLLGVETEPNYGPPRQGDIRLSYADATLAGKHLAWEASVPLIDGLRATIESLKKST